MDIYYQKPPQAVFDKFEIDAKFVESCFVKLISKTRKKVNEVLECRNEVIKRHPGKNYLYDLSKFSAYSHTIEGKVTHFLS